MKNANHVCKISSWALIVALVAAFSCKKAEEERITLEDTQVISDEAKTDSYFNDIDDMAGVVMKAPADTDFSGRISAVIDIDDVRFSCDGVVVTLDRDGDSTPQHPKGTITVDFGTGCNDFYGNVRAGKVIFTYDGRRFQPGSTVVTTVDKYSINGIRLTGTRTLINIQNSSESAPRFHAVLLDGKATFEDNTFATRESDITYEWTRAPNPANDVLTIDQSSTASGTTQAGKSYTVSLLEDLQYKRFCGIAVDGIKKVTIDGTKEITIDYGDGACDKTFTISMNGVTRTITLTN
jgi:hypothetical protein